jgi:hypothetical protein
MPARLVEADPMLVLAQINAYLAYGANVSFTLLFDDEVQNEVPFDRSAWQVYFQAAGFVIERTIINLSDIDIFEISAENPIMEWCFVLRKASSMVDLSPKPFYQTNGISSLKLINRSVCLNTNEVKRNDE